MLNFMPEAATRGVLIEKVFLEILQNSQENTCARVSFLIKLQAATWYFPVNFAKFLRTPFLQNTSGWLLLFVPFEMRESSTPILLVFWYYFDAQY